MQTFLGYSGLLSLRGYFRQRLSFMTHDDHDIHSLSCPQHTILCHSHILEHTRQLFVHTFHSTHRISCLYLAFLASQSSPLDRIPKIRRSIPHLSELLRRIPVFLSLFQGLFLNSIPLGINPIVCDNGYRDANEAYAHEHQFEGVCEDISNVGSGVRQKGKSTHGQV